ncbi:MAG TPA: LptA/OstA family protein, partial [Thermoanaerobaculia bacterium]
PRAASLGTKSRNLLLRRPDMQRTVRVLRIALPVVFIAFILVLYLSWDRSAGRRGKPAGEPVTSTQRPEDRPQAEAKAFEDVQTIGGRVVSRIRADRVVSFESGWTTLEGVALTIYRDNGLTYELVCSDAQFNSATKEAHAKGGVRLTTSDGIEVVTAEMYYDGARLSNEIPVQFRIDRWTGRAGALDLNVESETLRLHRNVDATMAAIQPGEQPMNVRGAESVFLRAENRVEFREGVEMDRGDDALRADRMNGRFSQDRSQLIGLEGNGNCVIVMAARSTASEGGGTGRATITSESFHTELGPDGRINAINTVGGAAPARAVLDGPPQRDIVARAFRVALENQIVSEIRAESGVVMKELGASPRQVQGEKVTIWFDKTTRRAQSAFLEGAFRYTDPRATASAFRANYDIAGDRIVLTTDAGWQATVVADGQTVKAQKIEFSPRAQTARATGNVIAHFVSRPKGSLSAGSSGVFPSGAPVFVNANELMMNQVAQTAHFTGNVKAWQDINTILSRELQVQGNGEVITASGDVRSVLYNTGSEAKKTPVQSRSEQLIGRRNDRRIELAGNVSIVDGTQTVEARKATFFLDDKQKVQRIEADNDVKLTESSTGRRGSGDKAVYHVDKRMIYVSGTPATVTDPSGSVTGQQISFDLTRNRVQVVSPEGQTKGTFKHEG